MWVLAAEVEAEGAIGRVRLLPAGYRRRTGRAMGAVTTGCCSCAIEPDRGDGPEAGLAAGFEGLDDDHPPAAARASIPVFVVATIRRDRSPGSTELGRVRRGGGGPMQCCWPGWHWRRGRSDGCDEIRRAGHGSGSGG